MTTTLATRLATLSPFEAVIKHQERTVNALPRIMELLDSHPDLTRPEALYLQRILSKIDRRSL